MWDPDLYLKFKTERFQPFKDLVKLIGVGYGLKVIDLGCGSGELTKQLHEYLPGSNVIGMDNSPEMIEKAKKLECEGLKFEPGSIEEVDGKFDLVFSNAAFHWVSDHQNLIPRLFCMLNEGGYLVAQFPSSHRNIAHRILVEIARQEPFYTLIGGWEWDFPVLEIEEYARLLYYSDAENIFAFDKVYPHILNNADDVYNFLSGTTIIPYLNRLPESMHDEFKETFRRRLWEIWDKSPVLFTFRRVFIGGKKK